MRGPCFFSKVLLSDLPQEPREIQHFGLAALRQRRKYMQ